MTFRCRGGLFGAGSLVDWAGLVDRLPLVPLVVGWMLAVVIGAGTC